MTHFRIELPIEAYLRVQDIQRRLLEHEIDPDQAAYEMTEVLAGHMSRLPGPDDTTEISLYRKPRFNFGLTPTVARAILRPKSPKEYH